MLCQVQRATLTVDAPTSMLECRSLVLMILQQLCSICARKRFQGCIDGDIIFVQRQHAATFKTVPFELRPSPSTVDLLPIYSDADRYSRTNGKIVVQSLKKDSGDLLANSRKEGHRAQLLFQLAGKQVCAALVPGGLRPRKK